MILLAAILTLMLAPIAVLHAYWGFGGVWPGRDAADCARRVGGFRGVRAMPSPAACFAVAAAIAIAALIPMFARRAVRRRCPRLRALPSRWCFSDAASPASPRRGGGTRRNSPLRRSTSAIIRRSAWPSALALRHSPSRSFCHDIAKWTAAHRHWRAGRLRQDHAHREALQSAARRILDRRRHQRHLHQGRRHDAGPAAGAAGGSHHGRRDRRLPAYGDPRGCLDQSAGDRRHAPAPSRPRHRLHRIRRRQSRRDLLARPRRSHALRDLGLPGRGDPAERWAGHHALRLPGDQQERPRALCERQSRRDGAGRRQACAARDRSASPTCRAARGCRTSSTSSSTMAGSGRMRRVRPPDSHGGFSSGPALWRCPTGERTASSPKWRIDDEHRPAVQGPTQQPALLRRAGRSRLRLPLDGAAQHA